MRTYLNCPFAEKDEAKALGARWDAAKKRWYVENPKDMAPFARWIVEGAAAAAGAAPARVDAHKPVRTGPKEAPDCGCDALPWEACVHTPAFVARRVAVP